MNESDFMVKFELPEGLQKQLDEMADVITAFVIKAFAVLYPDGDFPNNAAEEVTNLLIPKILEAMTKAVDRFSEGIGA